MSGQNEQTMASAALNSFDGVAGYGSFIPPEVVESAVGLSREHRKYGLRVVRLIWGLEALLEVQVSYGHCLHWRQSCHHGKVKRGGLVKHYGSGRVPLRYIVQLASSCFITKSQ